MAAAAERTEALSQKELADRLNVSPRQVRNLTNEGVISRRRDGSYPWPKAHQEWIAFKMTERERRYSKDKLNLTEEQARHTAIKAEIAELDLAERRGELVHVEDSTRLVRAALEAVDASLKTAPSRYAQDLAAAVKVPTARALRLLEDIIENVRGDLRNARRDGDDDDGAEAA